MERPNIEAWEAYECRDWIKELFCWIHDLEREKAALEAQLKAEQESVNELSLHCQGLEARLKGAESLLDGFVAWYEDLTGDDLSGYDQDTTPYQAWEALKGLGKEKENARQ